MRTRILITIILSLSIPSIVLSEAPVSASKPPMEPKPLIMPWKFYLNLAQCETNFRWHKSSLNYTSGYGIAKRTWRRWSETSKADRYTPREQAIVVDRIAFRGHTRKSGEFVYPVGPYGWAVIKYQNCMGLQQMICKSKHPLVQRWKRYC